MQAIYWLRMFGDHTGEYTPDLEGVESIESGGVVFRVGDVFSTRRFTGKIVGIGKPIDATPSGAYSGPKFRQTLLFIVIRDQEGNSEPGELTWIFFWPEWVDQKLTFELLETLASS